MNKFYPNAAAALKGPNGIQETYILKHGIVADLALVKAWKADTSGNVVFRKTIDTHTLVWWTFSPGNYPGARATISDSDTRVFVSAISAMESQQR